MKFTIPFCFLILIVIKLSSQYNDENNDVSDTGIDKGEKYLSTELDIVNQDIASFALSVKQSSKTFEQKLIQMLLFVQRNIDKILENLAVTISTLFSTVDSPINQSENAVVPNVHNIRSFNDIGLIIASRLRGMKLRIHNRLEGIVIHFPTVTNKFNNYLTAYTDDINCRLNVIRMSYPGIDSEECSEMIKSFKSGIKVLIEATINCVKDSVISGTAAADNIDDLLIEDITKRVSDMKVAWNCIVNTDGNYFIKFLKCTNFGSIQSVWKLINSLTTKLDENASNILSKAEKYMIFSKCIGQRVRDNYDREVLNLLQTIARCSVNLNPVRPDISKCSTSVVLLPPSDIA